MILAQYRLVPQPFIKIHTMPTKTNKKTNTVSAGRTPEAESALKELFVD